MAFLLDTNLVSELRKKNRCDENVAAWQHSVAGQEFFISAITMMEIKTGILKAKPKNPVLAELLADWYENQIKRTFAGRVLPVDLSVSEACASLLSARSRNLADSLIAATADVHGLTLATRNTADFSDCGVRLLNPWQSKSN